jgi:hypothetical protein
MKTLEAIVFAPEAEASALSSKLYCKFRIARHRCPNDLSNITSKRKITRLYYPILLPKSLEELLIEA